MSKMLTAKNKIKDCMAYLLNNMCTEDLYTTLNHDSCSFFLPLGNINTCDLLKPSPFSIDLKETILLKRFWG